MRGNNVKIGCVTLILIMIVGALIGSAVTPWGRAQWNTWFSWVQKADDATSYETLKEVEDTCRAMIASYQTDALYYDQYHDSAKDTEQEWAEAARMRANKTAMIYNEYIRKNDFVWTGAIPPDINENLEIINAKEDIP